MVLTSITSGIKDFTVALVLWIYWESLSSLQRKILVTALSNPQKSIAQDFSVTH